MKIYIIKGDRRFTGCISVFNNDTQCQISYMYLSDSGIIPRKIRNLKYSARIGQDWFSGDNEYSLLNKVML
jgi:hypothetical protein